MNQLFAAYSRVRVTEIILGKAPYRLDREYAKLRRSTVCVAGFNADRSLRKRSTSLVAFHAAGLELKRVHDEYIEQYYTRSG